MLLGLTLVGLLMRVAHMCGHELFSVLLFAALIYIFVRSERGSTRTLLWTIPILVLWANFHGGWLVGVGTVGLWCIGAAWNGQGAMGDGRWASGDGQRAMGDGRKAVGEGQWARGVPILIAVAAAGATLRQPVRGGAVGFLDRDGQVRS